LSALPCWLRATHLEELVRVKTLQRSVAAMLCLLPSVLWALGMGGIELSSGLNQPFDAKIPIVGAKQGELADASAGLAEKSVFDRAGLTRPYTLTTLKFQVVATGDESGYIHITSRDAMREPALEFIVEMKWGNGSLQREYSVLLERK
jgi:pilus assembly protein FimV